MAKDILCDDAGELVVVHGDLVIGDSDSQHLAHLLTAVAGEYKEDPILGVGVSKYLKSANTGSLGQSISTQLEYDNWQVDSIEAQDLSSIYINAKRKE